MSFNLAYCGFGIVDPDAWRRFAVEGLGLQCSMSGDVIYLRMDDRPWRFSLHATGEDDLIFVGFEMGGGNTLQDFVERISAAGIEYQTMPPRLCAERHIDEGIFLFDPQGLRLEFSSAQRPYASAPFESHLTKGFVTGEQGLGHLVFAVDDLSQSVAFYERLGLKLSDFIEGFAGPLGKLRIAFMHCNARHHTLAMACLPGGKRLNHVMIEVADMDDVIIGHQRCKALGYPAGNIGRHPNDRMLSFYVPSPSGFDVEVGYGGATIDEGWTVAEYDGFSLWGHERSA